MARQAVSRFAICPIRAPRRVKSSCKFFACGLNHLDLWLEEGGLPAAIQLPRTPGCEIAGRILTTGEGREGLEQRLPVAIQSNIFCGRCEFCSRRESRFA